MNKKPHIIVAMSGGVDSSVAAWLLQQQGYPISGLFMKNWEGDDTEEYCSASQDIADAEAVCDKLGIPLFKVNFAKEYWDNVFERFLTEYQQGRTPNPDIWCNKEIKFKAFLDHAQSLGADYIATGHYARVAERNGHFRLLTGLDGNKDQSYFLYTLGQAQLSKAYFPIGELKKDVVRQIANEAGFINHAKKDSTGICFIGERKFKEFLNRYLPMQPGNIESIEGEIVGQHDGLTYYTIGQRQGLGIGGMRSASEQPWYVAGKDMQRNVLIVAQGHDHPALLQQQLRCNDLHWTAGIAPSLPLQCRAKVRYRTQAKPCQLIQYDDQNLEVIFTEPEWAITPGQSIVFYQDDECLGGGIIESVSR